VLSSSEILLKSMHKIPAKEKRFLFLKIKKFLLFISKKSNITL